MNHHPEKGYDLKKESQEKEKKKFLQARLGGAHHTEKKFA